MRSGKFVSSSFLNRFQLKTECRFLWYHSSVLSLPSFRNSFCKSPPPVCWARKANSINSCSLKLLIMKKILPVVSISNCCSLFDLRKLSTTGLKEETAPSNICWSSHLFEVSDYLYSARSGYLTTNKHFLIRAKYNFYDGLYSLPQILTANWSN